MKVKEYEDYSVGEFFNSTHRVTPEIIATTALWTEYHNTAQITLGDLPLSLFKYNTINSYTLLELERALEKIAYRSYADDLNFFDASLIECPDLMLSLSDDYMAALVNKLSEKYRNILVICGYG